MTGKLVAGLVCGAAAAVPGRFMLESTVGAFEPLMGRAGSMDLTVTLAPFAVAGVVLFVCMIAPNPTGAWLRGCLIVTAVAAVTTLQAAQCYGMDWLFREMFNDRAAREAATLACPEGQTPLVSGLIAAGAVVFGLAALVVWRGARRGEDL